VWSAWRGSELRLVEGSHEEWVVDPLDGADFARRIRGCNSQSMFARDVLRFGREAVRTGRVLHHMPSAVQPVQERARRDLDRYCLVLERAFKKRDDWRSARAVFGVGGITNPGKAACVLDQHVLKAASSTDQRDVPLACLPDDGISGVWISVRGAGPDDDRGAGGGDPSRVTNRVGRDDLDLDRDPAMLGCVSERSQSRAMVRVVCR
jgi:hypothetical protein